MRSVLDALPGHLRTFHLITADYPFSLTEDIPLIPHTVKKFLEVSLSARTLRAGDRTQGKKKLSIAVPDDPREKGSENPNVTELDSMQRSVLSVSSRLASHLSKEWRVAQTPTWLDFARRNPASPGHPYHPSTPQQQLVHGRRSRLTAAEANYPTFRYATHSEIFHLPSNDRDGVTEELGEREWKTRDWREKALPSFNSMAIESRVGWLPGLVCL